MASCVRWNSSASRRYAVAFFDRVEILALDVLDQRHLEDVVRLLGLATSRTTTGTRRRPACCAARQRRSPAMIW